jgi:hypothetical protein
MFLHALLLTPYSAIYLAIASSIALATAVAMICYCRPPHAPKLAGFDAKG